MRDALLPYANECREECWRLVPELSEDFSEEQRQQAFRAALLLATWDPPHGQEGVTRWQPLAASLGDYALGWTLLHPDDHLVLVEGLRPLTSLLSPRFQDSLGKPEDESRRSATRFLRDLHAGDNRLLTEMVTIAAPWQWPFLKLPHDRVDPQWLREILRENESTGDTHQRERRIATAAAMLLWYGSADEVWNLLQRSPQQLIDRLARIDAPLERVEKRLAEESDAGIVQGLLLVLGNFPRIDERLAEVARERVTRCFSLIPMPVFTPQRSGSRSAAASRWIRQPSRHPASKNDPATTDASFRKDWSWFGLMPRRTRELAASLK